MHEYLNNIEKSVLVTWITAAGITLILYLALLAVQKFVTKRWESYASKTAVIWDDLLVEVLHHIKKYFLFFLSLYLGLVWVKFSARSRMIIDKTFMMVAFLQAAQSASIVLNFWLTKHLRVKSSGDMAAASTVGLISVLVKAVVYSIILLLALNNLGVNISALIAGLGVGGVAVALALQNILADLFSSLTIILDKPFIVGDFIVVGELMGTVEHIGLKTTRLRSISGEQLIFGNGDLLQSRIKNFKRMYERRIVQSLTVTYQTDSHLLDEIPGIVRGIVESQDKIRFERCHFLRFQDSALEFELVYWVLSSEFLDYADRAQAINVAIFKKFGEIKVDFAYPTQTLFISK